MAPPDNSIEQRVRALSPERLAGVRRGIEKESLRTRPDGLLATTPHPVALGSALTHPRITTDFSESQLELITGVHASTEQCLEELTRIHQFVYRTIDGEMLWVGSMPCGLPADDAIPIGHYGSSNVGRAKSIYRMGLSHRYGRQMQTISGIHYNWSMPGVTTEQYFSLIRNFRRHSFLLLFLFGASPAVCSSFVAGRVHELEAIRGNTLGLPFATSLRMGRLGYQSDAQSSLAVSYNNLENYARSLHEALTRPHPEYEAIGIRGPDGQYRQLNNTLLQIENEFYGTIRPKRVINPGERPLHALRERGVEYVEVRCLDLDPFESIGISAYTARIVDIFLLHCLLADSPPDTPQEIAALGRNQDNAAMRGREPGLLLERGGQHIPLIDWGAQLLDECTPIAAALDESQDGRGYRDSLAAARSALRGNELSPSARVLKVMRDDYDSSYVRFILARSLQARQDLLEMPWSAELAQTFRELARASIENQKALEAPDEMPFEQYREQYLSPVRLGPVR